MKIDLLSLIILMDHYNWKRLEACCFIPISKKKKILSTGTAKVKSADERAAAGWSRTERGLLQNKTLRLRRWVADILVTFGELVAFPKTFEEEVMSLDQRKEVDAKC